MFDPASVRFRGPLIPYVDGFWSDLLRQGYSPLRPRPKISDENAGFEEFRSARNGFAVRCLAPWSKSERSSKCCRWS
jgi:hypothetical protein